MALDPVGLAVASRRFRREMGYVRMCVCWKRGDLLRGLGSRCPPASAYVGTKRPSTTSTLRGERALLKSQSEEWRLVFLGTAGPKSRSPCSCWLEALYTYDAGGASGEPSEPGTQCAA